MLKTLFALAFTAATFAASGTHAADGASVINVDQVTSKVAVTVNDADFTDPQKVAQVYERLKDASKAVCETTEPGPAFRTADDRACEREAVQGAVRELNQPLLNEIDSGSQLASAQPTRTHETRRETR